jgi:hypothetical protein
MMEKQQEAIFNVLNDHFDMDQYTFLRIWPDLQEAIAIPSGPTTEPKLLAEGYIAYGERDQTEGRQGRYEVGRYATEAEAVAAARGKGVQGDSGYVNSFRKILEGVDLRLEEKRIVARRPVPSGGYAVGYLDMREYEYGVRSVSKQPVRPADTSIFARNSFAVGAAEGSAYPVLTFAEMKKILTEEPEIWVGAWRRPGDEGWRGEFTITATHARERWLLVNF